MGVMTESTAAAMAYGLFVSPTVVVAAGDVSGENDTSNDAAKNENENNESNDATAHNITGGKRILVFDMGGGTTDVTIALMDSAEINDEEETTSAIATATTTDNVRFHVVATAGDQCLGGDNVDELLARYLWKRHCNLSLESSSSKKDWKASNHQELIRQCRRAKEELCGNDDSATNESGTKSNDSTAAAAAEGGMESTSPSTIQAITLDGKKVELTPQEFDKAIQPLIDRAEHVVDEALSSLLESHLSSSSLSSQNIQINQDNVHSLIHEVVLVGGSSHIPTLRSMLRRKFPPPIPPELCTSISAETAVAQGLAIQAALVSGVVPLWELRNAMMLDVLPHSFGVWVITGGYETNNGTGAPFATGDIIEPNKQQRNGSRLHNQGHYVPILYKDSPLPAKGSATFTLADRHQSGVTVVAVEQIGPGEVYQCMGVFDFLLFRLPEKESIHSTSNDDNGRHVEVGMTLETSGQFVVSIFDENDPDHREKRRRYLKEKALKEGVDTSTGAGWKYDANLDRFYEEDEDDGRVACSGTEIGLVILCSVLFALYVGARMAFNDLEMQSENDEL